jgi:L-lysine epsilon oxidase-like protein/VWA domain-containing protein
MATTYRIHPAIGIARLGDSPEFFVGPERLGQWPEPSGGFKDSQCRVKRQAARFRIFAVEDDDTFSEITDAEAEITWTVHLANRKAANPARGNDEAAADMTIDPGTRTLTGPDQQALFDTGVIRFAGASATTVPLGEVRSDDAGRLIVLGGAGKSASPRGDGIVGFWGNTGWYDDIADGSVSAAIKLRSDGTTPPVAGAWVISAPPKFAPQQDSPLTLYDRIFEAMVGAGLATAPTSTSYTRDIYPILERAKDIKGVYSTFAHNWAHPVINQGTKDWICSRLRPPGDMPVTYEDDSALSATQRAHLQRWQDGVDFTDDWAGAPAPEPAVSPDGMDRAALQACVGGAFYPGIEAGGMDGDRPIVDAALYSEAFRIDHAVALPGTMTASMALPWQADFYDCGYNWWPVPRPNAVRPQGGGVYQQWDRDIGGYEDMVAKWSSLGFIVRQSGELVETERCDTPSITLLTPHLSFIDVPQGPMGMVREAPLAITFEIISPGAAVTLEYAPGGAPNDPQLSTGNLAVSVGPTGGSGVATARLWIIYSTGLAPSAIATQTVTVLEPVSGQTWDITIDANTVARKTSAVAMVLDRSGSMADDRGDGVSKHVALQDAAKIFVGVMLDGDGVGLVRYDQDAQVVQPVLKLGAGDASDVNRQATIDRINGLDFDPAGATSIGDGIFQGREILDDAAGDYDLAALTVLTDGIENSPLFIADVSDQIDEKTYAVGLGSPQNTSAAALQTLSGNNGGYLLVTGAIDLHNAFRLQKYFLQILSSVSSAEVVLDPDGRLTPGAVHRIPFQLTDADAGVDVILLSPDVQAIDFRLQTPSGRILEPWRAVGEPAMRYETADGVAFYRLVLPLQLMRNRFDQAGTWHALLTLGEPRLKPGPDGDRGVDLAIANGLHAKAVRPPRASRRLVTLNELQRRFDVGQAAAGQAAAPAARAAVGPRGVPYSLVVNAYSSVSLRVQLRQDSYEPGARIALEAVLTQSGLPILGEAAIWAEITRPDGAADRVTFRGREDGAFTADLLADSPGAHSIRVRARGRTRSGQPFTREQTLTAVVWRGGDQDAKDPPREGRRLVGAMTERGERDREVLKRRLHDKDGRLRDLAERLSRLFHKGDGEDDRPETGA